MADNPAHAWRTTIGRRLVIATAAFVLWSVAIEAQLVYLQVVQHAELSGKAERQQQHTIDVPAKRGEILDRHGRVLAYSVDTETIYAVPTELEDGAGAVESLCGALQDCSPGEPQTLAERLEDPRRRNFAFIRRQVAQVEQVRRVAALELDGIGFMSEERRFYPNRELAAHLLGYVGVDNTGLGGIEAAYDSLIKGQPGKVLVQADARRQAFSRLDQPASSGTLELRPPTTGATLELTIDQYLQHIAERELRAGVERSKAAGGSALVMDPYTGEILALANYPTFNPNAYREVAGSLRRNRAIQDLYEPGSTFKIVTAGAALEEKVIGPDDLIDVSTGSIRFGSRVIRDVSRYGIISFEDVIVKSSNVGAIKVGLDLGAERLSRYAREFGFGRPTSPDFRGESAGIVWDASQLNDSALASVAMGYQVGVTPLQMAAGVSVVANGGELVEPRVVRAVLRDETRVPVPRRVIGRAISPGTAAQLTSIMEAVVDRGTAQSAQVAGYTIAGKTGTAAKLVNGRYSRTDYNVSFVGFVPSRDPLFAIIVVVDTPRETSAYGGVVAAPIFQRIADAALRAAGVPPSFNAPPPLLATSGEPPRAEPASGRLEDRSAPVAPALATITEDGFPDLTGLSAREAVLVLARVGFTARVHGTGVVIAQQPAAGTPLHSGSTATVWLERQAAAPAAHPAVR